MSTVFDPDDITSTNEALPEKIYHEAAYFRRWYCAVKESGFHNGATCANREPHKGWGCRWVYETPFMDEEEVRARLRRNPEIVKPAWDRSKK